MTNDDEPVIIHKDMPPEIVSSLGRVVLIWSHVEYMVAAALAALTGANHDQVYILLAESSANWRIDRLRALADRTLFMDRDLVAAFDAWAVRAHEVRARRNKGVHSGVWFNQNSGTWLVGTPFAVRKGRLRGMGDDVEAGPFLEDLVADAGQLYLDLNDVFMRMQPVLEAARADGVIWSHPDTFKH